MPRDELKALSDINQQDEIKNIYRKCRERALEGYYFYEYLYMGDAEQFSDLISNSSLFKDVKVTYDRRNSGMLFSWIDPKYDFYFDWS